MGMDLVFRIAMIGIVITVINQVLKKADREEYATVITIVGTVMIVLMAAQEVAAFFETIRELFDF